MALPKVVRYLAAGLVFAFAAGVLLLLLPIPEKRHHVFVQDTHEFGIGFDLSASYGTVAVSYPNGTVQMIARVDGNEAYREMMLRLSLRSSTHFHRPYQNMGDSIGDMPRQAVRSIRKRLGLPASRDVGTVSTMIGALRDKASEFVGEPVTAAAISRPHIAALYTEDLSDAFEYLSIDWLDIYRYGVRHELVPIYTTKAAQAGNGHGLCADYRDVVTCQREEESKFPVRWALSVAYTDASLFTHLAMLGDAYSLEEGRGPERAMHLGFGARHQESYWEEVREVLRDPIVNHPIKRNVSMVLLCGDAAEEPRFRELFDEVVGELIDGEPELFDHDPEFIAAKGVAELAKRELYTRNQEPGKRSDL